MPNILSFCIHISPEEFAVRNEHLYSLLIKGHITPNLETISGTDRQPPVCQSTAVAEGITHGCVQFNYQGGFLAGKVVMATALGSVPWLMAACWQVKPCSTNGLS